MKYIYAVLILIILNGCTSANLKTYCEKHAGAYAANPVTGLEACLIKY